DLTRQRAQLTGEKASVANRIQKVLEDANIKLGSVASDVLGASGRDMLRALVSGQDSGAALANLARGRLRDKLPQLRKALAGRGTPAPTVRGGGGPGTTGRPGGRGGAVGPGGPPGRGRGPAPRSGRGGGPPRGGRAGPRGGCRRGRARPRRRWRRGRGCRCGR